MNTALQKLVVASWTTLPFFQPWLVKHHGESPVLLALLLVVISHALFCNKHICIDALFMKIFVFSLLLVYSSPGMLLPPSENFPYLFYLEAWRLYNIFYYNPKCTQSLCRPTHSGTLAFYQPAHPFHDRLPAEVTHPPLSLPSFPSSRSETFQGSELQNYPDDLHRVSIKVTFINEAPPPQNCIRPFAFPCQPSVNLLLIPFSSALLIKSSADSLTGNPFSSNSSSTPLFVRSLF